MQPLFQSLQPANKQMLLPKFFFITMKDQMQK